MGTTDLPRLTKGLLLAPDFRARFVAGMAVRADELRADLDLLQSQALQPLAPGADLAFQQWASFCEHLTSFDPLDHMALRHMLSFSALRAVAHRCARVPLRPAKGSEALPIPLRCLFHLGAGSSAATTDGPAAAGCLAEDFKPATCASFFCPAQPGLLVPLRAELSFGDFCLANMRLLTADQLHSLLLLELTRPFVREPKIVVGPPDLVRDVLDRTCADSGLQPPSLAVSTLSHATLAHLDRALPPVAPSPSGTAERSRSLPFVLHTPPLVGQTLCDLALALSELARSHPHTPVYALAPGFDPDDPVAHPSWRGASMGQPAGGFEIIFAAP
jgi:hypothetical protein